MAINTIPVFPVSWQTAMARINTANANLDGTGTIADIYTAGTSGALIYHIQVKAEVTTTAGMIRLYIKKAGTYYIFDELIVTAITKSATVPSFVQTAPYNIKIEAGDIISASTEKAEMFSITVFGGEYE